MFLTRLGFGRRWSLPVTSPRLTCPVVSSAWLFRNILQGGGVHQHPGSSDGSHPVSIVSAYDQGAKTSYDGTQAQPQGQRATIEAAAEKLLIAPVSMVRKRTPSRTPPTTHQTTPEATLNGGRSNSTVKNSATGKRTRQPTPSSANLSKR